MTEFTIDNYTLELEAKRLAQECFDAGDTHGDDPNEYLWQACDGHEWAIYTYKALMLCANCDTSDGEDYLEGLGHEYRNIGAHACVVAFATLYCAAMDALATIEQEARDNA